MALYDRAFWLMSFFLIGVAAESLLTGVRAAVIIILLATALLALFLFLRGKVVIGCFSLLIIVGCWYANWFTTSRERAVAIPFDQRKVLTGLVVRVAQSGSGQRTDIDLTSPYNGMIRAAMPAFPGLIYGDQVTFTGTPQSIVGPSAGYLRKEGVSATINKPSGVSIESHGNGSTIKARLFTIRTGVESIISRVFTPAQATLMTGLILGKSGGFSKEFTEQLKATGTTHLVALSGYNIAVIVNGLLLVLGFVLHRRYAVWLCVIAVIGFVIMTGAEASVVRAAIMATIMIIAERASRVYAVRNAVLATAVVMVLANPQVLVFDIGFQLSFLALLGIVYVQPALATIFRIPSDKPSFFKWRENLLTTTAAQLAVLPILLINFGFFSPLAIITNVLLLSAVPATMFIGLIVIGAYLLSPHLAFIASLPARLLLNYELSIISIFSKIPLGFTIGKLPVLVSSMYYVGLVYLVIRARRQLQSAAVLVPQS